MKYISHLNSLNIPGYVQMSATVKMRVGEKQHVENWEAWKAVSLGQIGPETECVGTSLWQRRTVFVPYLFCICAVFVLYLCCICFVFVLYLFLFVLYSIILHCTRIQYSSVEHCCISCVGHCCISSVGHCCILVLNTVVFLLLNIVVFPVLDIVFVLQCCGLSLIYCSPHQPLILSKRRHKPQRRIHVFSPQNVALI